MTEAGQPRLHDLVRQLLGARIPSGVDVAPGTLERALGAWVEDLMREVVTVERFPIEGGGVPMPGKATEWRIYCHACHGTFLGKGEPEYQHPTHGMNEHGRIQVTFGPLRCPLAGLRIPL